MCTCVRVHVCAGGCEGKERPGKIVLAILYCSLPCSFEARSLTEPVARLAASKPQLSPISVSLKIQGCIAHFSKSACKGAELWSSCLCGQCPFHRTISLATMLYFYLSSFPVSYLLPPSVCLPIRLSVCPPLHLPIHRWCLITQSRLASNVRKWMRIKTVLSTTHLCPLPFSTLFHTGCSIFRFIFRKDKYVKQFFC